MKQDQIYPQDVTVDTPLEILNLSNKDTLMESLGMEYTSVKMGEICGKMIVDRRTHQPAGLLHGGAKLALAETLAGMGSAVMVDLREYSVVGFQVSGNHVGTVQQGFVYGFANILHKGKNTHVWNIDIKDENGRLISTCRVTNMIIPRKK
ncbi:hotdog fold thioesterase [Puteibacter caeruleilacunae]|nr:hotdog fold thioesterase [Puteibacter caeruleilacunae]